MIKPRTVPLLIVALCALHTPARSGPYDLIVADTIDLTLCQSCGIQLGPDYALIVNTGTTDITSDDLASAAFIVKASRPEIELRPSINGIVGPIHPGEAMGNISDDNQLLVPFLMPGETLRDLSWSFMTFFVWRDHGTYEGPVDFEITMVLAGYESRFTIHAQVHLGQPQFQFLTASRISAFPATVPSCQGASANPEVLWPANGQLVPVEIVGVTDPQGDPVTIVVTEITQDEPVLDNPRRPPSQRECFDGRISGEGAEVRAERNPGGNGRVYIVRFNAYDPQGGTCQGRVMVCVPPGPHEACVIDPRPYDSVNGCPFAALPARQLLDIESKFVMGRALEYTLTQPSDVSVELFDLAGRRVVSVNEGPKPAGRHTVRWSSDLSKGVYFVRMHAGGIVESRRLFLVGD